MDYSDGRDKNAAKKKWKAENGTDLMIAIRKHETVMECLNGIQRGVQKSRFVNRRTFVEADNTVDVEVPERRI